jgi:hypothetical protein
LCSNSSWIASNVPSITYGLRGVVHCNIEVRSHIPVHISLLIHLPILRSHQEALKIAIPVLTVVVGTSLCGTCERFSPARCRFGQYIFQQDPGPCGSYRPQSQRAHTKFLCEFSFLSLRNVTYWSLINVIPTPQTTKCDHSTKKKRDSSAC